MLSSQVLILLYIKKKCPRIDNLYLLNLSNDNREIPDENSQSDPSSSSSDS